MVNYGKKIKDYREENEITQKELAQELGISVTTLYNWENGVTQPKPEYIEKLKDLLFANAESLPDETPERQNDEEEGDAWAVSEIALQDDALSNTNGHLSGYLFFDATPEKLCNLKLRRRVRFSLQIGGIVLCLFLAVCSAVFALMNFCVMYYLSGARDGATVSIKFPFSWGMCGFSYLRLSRRRHRNFSHDFV